MSKPPTEPRDWTSASEALFRSERSRHAPREADRERVRRALAQRLAEGPNPPGSGDTLNASGSAVLSTYGKIGLAVVVLATASVLSVQTFLRKGESAKRVDSQLELPAKPMTSEPLRELTPSSEAPGNEAVHTVPSASSSARSRQRESVVQRLRRRSARELARAATAPASPSEQASVALGTASVPEATQQSRMASAPVAHDPSAGERLAAADPQSHRDDAPAKTVAVNVEPEAANRSSARSEGGALKHAEADAQVQSADQVAAHEIDPSDPRAELAFVRRIQAALQDSQLREALALCAEHEQRWPRGTFVQEREGLRAIASCKSEARDASARANGFFAKYARSPLAPRVRQACAVQLEAAAADRRTPATGETGAR